MKVSTKGRYGLSAMIDIAVHHGNTKCTSLKSIANRQGISENYLEQIVAPLKKAGFIKSIRGSYGGYTLNKNANEIYIGEILRVLEGTMYPVECLDGSGNCYCGDSNCDLCVTKSIWNKIYKSLSDIIDTITLQDLVDDYNKINNINN